MRYFILIFMWTGLFSTSLAQPSSLESYQQELHLLDSLLDANAYPALAKQLALSSIPPYGTAAESDSASIKRDFYQASFYYETGRFAKALPLFEAILSAQIETYGPDDARIGRTYNDIGVCHGDLGRYEEAKKYYEKYLAVSERQTPPDPTSIAIAHNNFGIFYERQGDYTKALEEYEYSLQLRLDYYQGPHYDVGQSYMNIGNVYFYTQDIPRANEYYQKALAIYQKIFPPNDPNLGYAYMNLAIAAAMSGEMERAERLFLKDLDIRLNAYGETHPYVAHSYDNLGLLYKMQARYEPASAALQHSLEISASTYGPGHPVVAQSYNNLAELADLQGNSQKAAALYFQGLGHLQAYQDGVFLSPEQVTDLPKCLLFLKGLTRIQQKHAPAKRQAWATIQFVSELTDYMRQRFQEEGSRLYLQESVLPLLERGIALALDLAVQHPDSAEYYRSEAFLLGERASGVLLQKVLSSQQALDLPEIPDSSRQQIQAQQQMLNFYRQQLNSASDSALIASYRSQKIQLQTQFDSLQSVLKDRYPRYQERLQTLPLQSPQQIRQSLNSPDEGVLSYFVGDSSVYAFYLDQDTLGAWKLETTASLLSQIQPLRQSIYRYFLQPDATDSLYQADLRSFRTYAFQLYQQLWEPLEAVLKPRLRIIPQGELGYLPFEVLLSDTLGALIQLDSYPYLIKKYVLSYGFSAGMQTAPPQGKQGSSQALLAIAPGFASLPLPNSSSLETQRSLLGPLPFTLQEVAHIQQTWPGNSQVLSARKATKAQFLALASQFNILHIATHGHANDVNPSRSFLAFSGSQDTTVDKLFLDELFPLSLSADLVVLSACETGIGKLNRGEGIASIARAFAQAGARSILTTLWQVNDEQTSQIMGFFYAQISEGAAKDMALREARLAYFQSQDAYHHHPFFWAGYIAIGDMRPLDTSGFPWGLALLGLVGLGLLGGWFWKNRPVSS